MLATLADLGVATRQGTEWAADDIEDALWGPGNIGWDETHPDADRIASAIQAAADELVDPIGTDVEALAREAPRWKGGVSFAEIVAETGLWKPPDPAAAPCLRIEGRRDVATESGQAVSVMASRDDAEYWGVYAIGPEGLADWTAGFADLDVARRHAARWRRPGSLVCTDRIEDRNEQESPPLPERFNPYSLAGMSRMLASEDASDRPAGAASAGL